jgi:N-acetylglucosamine-6-phosphate deacetylase
MKIALINASVFDGEKLLEGHSVVVEQGRIADITRETPRGAERLDLEGRLLAPGLIDIQVNGGGGVLFNDQPTVEGLRAMSAAHRRFGTTGFLPTLISTDPDTMGRAVAAVRRAIAGGVPGVLGIHLEGPFLNPQYAGIHDAGRFIPLDDVMIALLASLTEGKMLVTVAPERIAPGTITALAERGVLVFGGHSAANYEQVRAALGAGLRGFTHLFNAMTPFGSREPGMVGAALEDKDSWCGIIADGRHVHPASFAVAVSAKARGGTVLVTDAMSTVGSAEKTFRWKGETVTVTDGACRLPDGSLAGSDLDMMSAVRNAMDFASLDRLEALRMASLYPAQALGLDHELGRIRPGFRASLIELDEALNLRRSWVDGKRYEAGEGG